MTTSQQVTVVVPVYNALTSLERLVESLRVQYHQPAEWLNFVFVDDASSDPSVQLLLSSDMFFQRTDVRVYVNGKNLGFVRTVNFAITAARPTDNIVLLNSDTIVTGPVFETLTASANRLECVGSLTPWTNKGTIASLFNWPAGSDEMIGLTPAEVESVIRNCGPRDEYEYVKLPTGVGFCMYMSRDAINAVGLFNDKVFERGYGEENDWCQRALKAGFPSYLCPETFVFHQETQSFSDPEKARLAAKNRRKLERLHAEYRRSVAIFLRDDPLQYLRFKIILALALFRAERHNRSFVVQALHKDPWLGLGGTERHVLDLAALTLSDPNGFMLVLNPLSAEEPQFWRLSLVTEPNASPTASLFLDTKGCVEVLPAVLHLADTLHVHHLQNWPPIMVEVLLRDYGAQRIITLHDYSTICPHPNMFSGMGGRYCEVETNREKCNSCYFNSHGGSGQGTEEYTRLWLKLLDQFDQILFPSDSAKTTFCKGVHRWELDAGLEERASVVPNPILVKHTAKDPVEPEPSRKSKLVVFLGGLNQTKGSELIRKAAPILRRKGFTVEVWGHMVDAPPRVRVRTYRTRDELAQLGERHAPSVVAMPSIVPETFGFTVHEALTLLKAPVVVGPFGHPAALVKEHDCGDVLIRCESQDLIKCIVNVTDNFGRYRHGVARAIVAIEQQTEEALLRIRAEYGKRSASVNRARLEFPVAVAIRHPRGARLGITLQEYYLGLVNASGLRGRIKRTVILSLYRIPFLRVGMRWMFRRRYSLR